MRYPEDRPKVMGSAARAGMVIITATIAVALTTSCTSSPRRSQSVPPWPPAISWSALGTVPSPPPHNSYRLLDAESTRALFPAAVGVTRVAAQETAAYATGDRRVITASDSLRLAPDPRNEFLQWNSAFDHLMGVSEVFPVAQRDLGGAAVETANVLTAMRALRARLGLIYAVNHLSASRTEMFGVMYDTSMARPLAVVHAVAESLVPADRRSRRRSNPWESDSRGRVRSDFADLVSECLRELMLRDQPTDVEPTTGWTPEPLFMPAESSDSPSRGD